MSAEQDAGFEALLGLLQQSRGFDFTGYKRPSLTRRIAKRMQMLGLEHFGDYGDYLEVHPDEFGLLFNAILINVTAFFRDEAPWDYLRREVLPAVIAAKGPHDWVRVWSAGCASGQEAYSIAIALAEAMGEDAYRERVKVYATDVDDEALAQARLASYSPKDVETVDPALRERYFEAANGRYVFRNDLRRSVIFGRHDLMQDAPISRLDLLLCRNTLMYFNAETQTEILQRFHFALNGDGRGNGYLFLGRAEMLLTHGGLFTPVDLKCRVFAKVPAAGQRPPATLKASGNDYAMTRNDRLRELVLEESPVARIVVDADGVLAMANQKARILFSINAKDIGRALQDLEISYRPVELRALIEEAYAERRPVTRNRVERKFPQGEALFFDVVVAPLYGEGQAVYGTSVNYLDVTRYTRLQEELQRSREEVQTTNEELQSSNEELETTNEELQSTNEELETMNEELQSTNEELQSVNAELRQRTEEMSQLTAFFESVFGNVPTAAVVVNHNLDVLMWNHRAEDLWGLRAGEVQGKGLLNLDIGLPLADLRGNILPVLAGDTAVKEIVLDAVNRRGKKIRCRVTCTPLLSGKNKRDGVILLMEEIAA